MSLHLVFCNNGLRSCLRRRDDSEPIILLGDGVYATADKLSNCYYLRDDAEARGIATEGKGAILIDYSQMVRLTEQHYPAINWAD
ncbi:MAG: hypothetical protein CBC52_000325 [Gammaproteobacteria bacterium TMED92]|nr:MAG: hypothetical protein CBC52_000325 [Gammaproteobacteria bacterium TMED92]